MKTLVRFQPRIRTLAFTLLAGTLTFNAEAAPVSGGTRINPEQQG